MEKGFEGEAFLGQAVPGVGESIKSYDRDLNQVLDEAVAGLEVGKEGLGLGFLLKVVNAYMVKRCGALPGPNRYGNIYKEIVPVIDREVRGKGFAWSESASRVIRSRAGLAVGSAERGERLSGGALEKPFKGRGANKNAGRFVTETSKDDI